MARTKGEEKLYRALAAATRSGLYSATSTERGVLVEIDGREVPVEPDLVEQIVGDSSSVDVGGHIAALRQQRLDELGLDAASTWKLRYMLALGLGPARLLNTSERQLALSRTYYRQSRLRVLEGSQRYLDTYKDLPRGERESLLDRLAKAVVAEFERPQRVDRPSSATSADEGFTIVNYFDRHVIPTQPGRRRTVTRTRQIRANRDGVTEFRRSYFVTQTRSADPLPYLLGAGSFRIENKRPHSEAGGLEGYKYDVVLTFPPMNSGEERTLQWTVDVEQPELMRERRGTQTVTLTSIAPIEHAAISVRLDPALAGVVYVRIDGRNPHDVDLLDEAARAVVATDGYGEAEWDDVQPGLAYGLQWRWPVDVPYTPN